MRKIDITGQRFGRLLVVTDDGDRHVSPGGHSSILWRCQCDCGAVVSVRGSDLSRGETKSCGCLQRELVAARLRRHGHRHTATYGSWMAMLQRCRNPANKRWARYGGRGIKVCDRWLVFENFLADLGERPQGKTLDRWPNPDGDYEPNNCRWATNYQQRHNRSALVLTLVLLFTLVPFVGHSAEMSDCHTYANRGSAAALQQLLEFPWIDVSAGRFLYRKAYTFCLNADEIPPLVFTPQEQPIVDGLLPEPKPRPEPPPASVPAIDPAEEAKPAEPPGKALCIKHGKRTVYRGKHWRCVK